MTRVMMSSCFITLAILFVWRVQEVAEACTCSSPPDPHQALCRSDVVIRAKVTERLEVDHGASKDVKYNIIVIKKFKGPSRDIDAIYTPLFSSLCGVTLITGEQYLIAGWLKPDGTVNVITCNLVQPWEDLSAKLLKMVEDYKHYCS
ncbi:metalloproteinase inhibitor 2 [Austrofundulus limnaeus]|uniref:Metalloproteinase inhibitor 2 n=1 Tax=Austrofundulus limnaeus TaxID=52670 RepID=A0A2I4BCM4_AUSLI|nr:PREDICTED: metalloproteinase inhibitor 2-like [Austrofundulus limnaeus]